MRQMIVRQLRSLPLWFRCLLLIIIVVWTLVTMFPSIENPEEEVRKCYTRNELYSKVTIENVEILEYVEESSRKPTPDKTIFFHVTTCSSSGIVKLFSRLDSCLYK